MKNLKKPILVTAALILINSCAFSAKPISNKYKAPAGEKGNLTVPITHEQIESRAFTFGEIFQQGKQVFSTPFNVYDGLGDGPTKPRDINKSTPGKRPTLKASPHGSHGFALRVNGLDSQTCLECHSIRSNDAIPAQFLIGGVGGISAMAFPDATYLDVSDKLNNGFSAFDGRIINPPFIFGSGGIELLAMEMTKELHLIRDSAKKLDNIGVYKDLIANGVEFGKIRWVWVTKTGNINSKMSKSNDKRYKHNCNPPGTSVGDNTQSFGTEESHDLMRFIGLTKVATQWSEPVNSDNKNISSFNIMGKPNQVLELDVSKIDGVADDLIVRPFGRKGNNVTTRDFDCGAIRFHQGMEPVEIFGDKDHDEDGYVDEVTIGQMSALAIFNTVTRPPFQAALNSESKKGERIFQKIECDSCHIPAMNTSRKKLKYYHPEFTPGYGIFNTKPYYEVDLTLQSIGYKENKNGGIVVPLFSDLKQHMMGEELEENLHYPEMTDEEAKKANQTFITARLWGVADTAPYMHDGRATTLTKAILLHGGDKQAKHSRKKFKRLNDRDKKALLSYLRTLKTPNEL